MIAPSANGHKEVNIYAREYVPQAITAINESPATILSSVGGVHIDYEAYIAAYAGSTFISPLPELLIPEPDQPTAVRRDQTPTSGTYRWFFENCLALEMEAYSADMRHHALYGVALSFLPGQLPLYRLPVPGIRDGSPIIVLGQMVLLRQLILDPRTHLPQGMAAWCGPGGGFNRGLPAPGFTGFEIQATVYAVDKIHETVILQAQGLIHSLPLLCNVVFTLPPQALQGMYQAVREIGDRFIAQECTSWLRHILFPEERDGIIQTDLPTAVFDMPWYDKLLNHEQKKAIHSIVRQEYGKLPFLLYGPPGSGKTKTVCELVLQLANDPKSRGSILLCAPSNPAADTLAERLKSHLSPKDMFRLNDCSRTFAEVPSGLLSYCFVRDTTFDIPPLPELLSKKVVITTCRDAVILLKARATNHDIASLQYDVSRMLYPFHDPPDALPCHWLSLIIDEAAQATEPEAVIPIAVIDPHHKFNRGCFPLLIMAGDEHQLNARVYAPSTPLKISLFERLAKGPPYSSHPLARKNLGSKDAKSPIYAPFVNLRRNYRSHEAILAVPSTLFYENTLMPEATETDSLLTWSKWRGRRWPVLFACNGGLDECESLRNTGTGWHNQWELSKALRYARSLLDSAMSVEPFEICIMSPFQTQVRRLRKQAKALEMNGLNIGPMEAFQGLESRVVIICTTRARTRFLKDDGEKGIGIIGNEKKFNVAITRAKEGLIVIGNPWTMSTNQHWNEFLRFCYRNGLTEEEPQRDARMANFREGDPNSWWPSQQHERKGDGQGGSLTSLERAVILREREQSNKKHATRRTLGGMSVDDSLWQSGIDAQESLEQEEDQDDE